MTLHFDGLDLVGHPAIQLTVLTAEPGTPDHDARQLLGSLSTPTRLDRTADAEKR